MKLRNLWIFVLLIFCALPFSAQEAGEELGDAGQDALLRTVEARLLEREIEHLREMDGLSKFAIQWIRKFQE